MVGPRLRVIKENNRFYTQALKMLWRLQGTDSARVYMFHSVLERQMQVYSKFAITTGSFERFLEYELFRGQRSMDIDDLKSAVTTPRVFKNRFTVTFDDIYDSVYTNAYPVLKRLNIPFVIFVTPGLIGKIDPSSKNPFITKEHLEELMADDLCIVGSHGMEHKPFRCYTKEEALKSMIEAKTIMGREAELFAFPYGRRIEVSQVNIKCAENAGYYCAFSALDGSLLQRWFTGRWFLPRILVGEDYVNKHAK